MCHSNLHWPTPVALVTKIWALEHKIGYNSAYRRLYAKQVFGSANLLLLFKLLPIIPLPWYWKYGYFKHKICHVSAFTREKSPILVLTICWSLSNIPLMLVMKIFPFSYKFWHHRTTKGIATHSSYYYYYYYYVLPLLSIVVTVNPGNDIIPEINSAASTSLWTTGTCGRMVDTAVISRPICFCLTRLCTTSSNRGLKLRNATSKFTPTEMDHCK